MKKIKPIKKSHILIAWSAILVCLLVLTLYMIQIIKTNDILINEMNERIELVEAKQLEMQESLDLNRLAILSSLEALQEPTKVIFTNYGTWDNHSTDITASGLKTNSFSVNSAGMFTYDNKVVVATANTNRLNWPLKEGYQSFDLYEVITLQINDEIYEAIVLDVCGSCFGIDDEDYQRFDIFTVENSIGKVEGFIYE